MTEFKFPTLKNLARRPSSAPAVFPKIDAETESPAWSPQKSSSRFGMSAEPRPTLGMSRNATQSSMRLDTPRKDTKIDLMIPRQGSPGLSGFSEKWNSHYDELLQGSPTQERTALRDSFDSAGLDVSYQSVSGSPLFGQGSPITRDAKFVLSRQASLQSIPTGTESHSPYLRDSPALSRFSLARAQSMSSFTPPSPADVKNTLKDIDKLVGYHRRLSEGVILIPETTKLSPAPVPRATSTGRSRRRLIDDDDEPKPNVMPKAKLNSVLRLKKAMRENDEVVLAEIEERAQLAVEAKRQAIRDMLTKRGKDYMKQNITGARHHSPEKTVERRRAQSATRTSRQSQAAVRRDEEAALRLQRIELIATRQQRIKEETAAAREAAENKAALEDFQRKILLAFTHACRLQQIRRNYHAQHDYVDYCRHLRRATLCLQRCVRRWLRNVRKRRLQFAKIVLARFIRTSLVRYKLRLRRTSLAKIKRFLLDISFSANFTKIVKRYLFQVRVIQQWWRGRLKLKIAWRRLLLAQWMQYEYDLAVENRRLAIEKQKEHMGLEQAKEKAASRVNAEEATPEEMYVTIYDKLGLMSSRAERKKQQEAIRAKVGNIKAVQEVDYQVAAVAPRERFQSVVSAEIRQRLTEQHMAKKRREFSANQLEWKKRQEETMAQRRDAMMLDDAYKELTGQTRQRDALPDPPPMMRYLLAREQIHNMIARGIELQKEKEMDELRTTLDQEWASRKQRSPSISGLPRSNSSRSLKSQKSADPEEKAEAVVETQENQS